MADEAPGEARDTAVRKAAANVRSALAWRNISYSAAGRAIGMDPSNMSRRCNGLTPFDAGDLTLLANLVGVTPGHLLDGEPWPEAAEVMSCDSCSFRTTDGARMAGHCQSTGHRQKPYES